MATAAAFAPGFGSNLYLSGMNHPVADERHDADLCVEGEIPRSLCGSYLRNGPNPLFDPGAGYHIFDGDGMLHAVTLADGRASYRNRWVQTAGLAAERRAGRALFGGMSDPRPPDPELLADVGLLKNAANTHVIRHAGRTLCLWEAGLPTEVGPDLETLGLYDFAGRLAGPMTAHPKIDPKTGEMFFFGYSPVSPLLHFYAVDAAGELRRRVEVELRAPVMVHDFVVTDRHVVFLDAPAVFDVQRILRGESMLAWKPENGARLGVMPRDGEADAIVWIEIDPCYVFHFMNGWSAGDRVVVDAARLDRLEFGLDENGREKQVDTFLSRFQIDLATRSASCERIGELPGGFVQVSAAVAGLANRYGYMTTFSRGASQMFDFDSVTKYDLQCGTASLHHYGEGRVTGEPVFAPDPDGRAEDDGWLLSFVYDQRDHSSEFVILDARSLADGPVARVKIPRRVPTGFHASWLPA